MKSHSINKLLIAPAVLLSCAFVNSYVAHADGIQESSTTNIATVSQPSANSSEKDNISTSVVLHSNKNISTKNNALLVNDSTPSSKDTLMESTNNSNTTNNANTDNTNSNSLNFSTQINNNQNNNDVLYTTQLYSVNNRYWAKDYNGWSFYENHQRLSNQWIKWGNYWYYLQGDIMAADQVTYVADDGTFNGGYYCFDKNGHYRTNLWHKEYGTMRNPSGPYMYFGNDGRAVNGWQRIGNQWYYFSNHQMTADQVTYVADDGTFNGGYYCFDKNGHYRTNLWHKEYGTMRNPSGPYMYFGNDGRAVNGWQRIGNQWYYFDNNTLVTDEHNIYVPENNGFNSGYYSFDKNGHIIY